MEIQVVYGQQDEGLEEKFSVSGHGTMSTGTNGNLGFANVEENVVARVVQSQHVQTLALEFMEARELKKGN